jgi:hypothetical protein
MEGDGASRPDEARGCAEEIDRIGLVDQDVSANDAIKEIGVGKFLERDVSECDPSYPGCARALGRQLNDLRISVDTDNRSGRTDQLGSKHCNVAGTAAKVEHPHTRANLRIPHEALRERAQNGCLKDQPADFLLRMSENIFCLFRVVHGLSVLFTGGSAGAAEKSKSADGERREPGAHLQQDASALRARHADHCMDVVRSAKREII